MQIIFDNDKEKQHFIEIMVKFCPSEFNFDENCCLRESCSECWEKSLECKSEKINNYHFESNKITEARLAKNITQEELSKLVGLTSATISRYESGKRIPKVTHLVDLAAALNLPINYFFIEETENEQNH